MKNQPSKHTGRTPLLVSDPSIVKRICDVVKLGATYRDACGAVGIDESTLADWKAKAKKPDAKACYVEFAAALARARRTGQSALVAVVHRAARGEPVYNADGKVIGHRNGDWKAAQYLLACRDPQSYGTKSKHEHSGAGGQPIELRVYDAINLPATAVEDDEAED